MKFKYIGKRPYWVGEKKYTFGDISDKKYNHDFEKIIIKKSKAKKITKEEI